MNAHAVDAHELAVAALVARARAAQREFETWTPGARRRGRDRRRRGRSSSPAATARSPSSPCATPGMGDVADKIAKNRRKTIGLLRDLRGREIRRRHQRGSRARPDRDRAAGRRGRRDHAVDQSRRDAGEQHPQRAQGPQRDHPRAVAQGAVDARAAARVRARRARPRRRAARSRAAARRRRRRASRRTR